jgi:hypothetical protein
MTALTEDRSPDISWRLQTHPEGTRIELPCAVEKIWKGEFVGLNAAGYVTSYTAPTAALGLTLSTPFLGIADEQVDNSGGSVGDKHVPIIVDGMFQAALSGLAVDDVLKPVFVADSGALSKSSKDGAFAGRVWRYISSGVGIFKLCTQWGSNPNEAIFRTTPIISAIVQNVCEIIPASENHNGLIIEDAYGYVTTTMAGGTTAVGIITLYHSTAAAGLVTTGTTLGVVLTAVTAETDKGLMVATGTPNDSSAAAADNIIIVPAGKNVSAHLTTIPTGTSLAGACRVYVRARPAELA